MANAIRRDRLLIEL